jgi:hypothetical protein
METSDAAKDHWVIEPDFLFVAEKVNDELLSALNVSHVVAIGKEAGELDLGNPIPTLTVNYDRICEDLLQCVIDICDFVVSSPSTAKVSKESLLSETDQPSSSSTPESDDHGKNHSRYTSYDSTATCTPPHAGFTWRSVGTPSSSGTSAANTPSTPVPPTIPEGSEEDEASVGGEAAGVMNPVVFSTPSKTIIRGRDGFTVSPTESEPADRAAGLMIVCPLISDFRTATLLTALIMQVMAVSLREAFSLVQSKAPEAMVAPSDTCGTALLACEKSLTSSLAVNTITLHELLGAGERPQQEVDPVPVPGSGGGGGSSGGVKSSDVEEKDACSGGDGRKEKEKASGSCRCCVVM